MISSLRISQEEPHRLDDIFLKDELKRAINEYEFEHPSEVQLKLLLRLCDVRTICAMPLNKNEKESRRYIVQCNFFLIEEYDKVLSNLK